MPLFDLQSGAVGASKTTAVPPLMYTASARGGCRPEDLMWLPISCASKASGWLLPLRRRTPWPLLLLHTCMLQHCTDCSHP